MKKIKVSLGARSYYIYIGHDMLFQIKKILKTTNGMIITDDNVNKHWGNTISSLGLPIFSIHPGEKSKTIQMAEKIYRELLKYGLDRQSCLVAFGGGVVGDLTGYLAATYMRGISYIQVPTTVMAQVDSSIGGKTGVNLAEGKNLVGCFWQPKAVIVDVKFLNTLPEKEIKNGLAEVIKYGVIKDKKLFEYLEKLQNKIFCIKPELWMPIITKCATIKAHIVGHDELERKGLRVILNYGHTIGHAIESSYAYSGITHGEAVAIGMIVASKLSNYLGYLKKQDVDRQINLINDLISPNTSVSLDKIIERIRYDKKVSNGKLRFILAKKIGNVFVSDKVTKKDIKTVLGT